MTDPTPLPPELRARLADEADGAELEAMWALLAEAAPAVLPPSEAEALWDRVRPSGKRVPREAAGRATDRRPARAPRHRRRWVPAAAALLVLAGGIVFWTMRPVTIEAPLGQTATAALPDGSHVRLNSGTVLRHPRRFTREVRTVTLSGEAFFEVEPGAQPFVVETADARVTVLGTRFNVRARGATAVAVAEGRVALASGGASVELAAGEGSEVAGGVPTAPASVSLARATVWVERGFAVQNQPLGAILQELERRYAVRIDLAADAATDTLTLYFPQPVGVEAIVRDVCTARSLRYRRTSRGFEIY